MPMPAPPLPADPSRRYLRQRPELASARVLHVGIDENGLGPALGPLVVTGVAFAGGPKRAAALGELVGDSKALVSFRSRALGEAWARALSSVNAAPPRSPAELLDRLLLDDARERTRPCPPERPGIAPAHQIRSMCWPELPEAFEASDDEVEACRDAIASWSNPATSKKSRRADPISLVSVAVVVVCPALLNQALLEGRNKLLVDLHAMERLLLALSARDSERAPVDAVLGKVGGFARYESQLGPLSGRLCSVEQESNVVSSYRFAGLGRIAFLRDADASDPFVGLASLVGKYVRDFAMKRIARWLASADDEAGVTSLPDASGYHDPVTERFIEASALVRQRRGVPDRCFLRTK